MQTGCDKMSLLHDRNSKKVIASTLIIAVILIFSFNIIGLSDPLDEVEPNPRESLMNIAEDERKILEELFTLLQEIKEMEMVELQTSLSIESIEKEIPQIESLIEAETRKYNENLDIMEKVLKSYQRGGAISYLELILSSDSLGTLLKRINALRDITRNTNNLLETLEESKEKLITEKDRLDERLHTLESEQKELRKAIDNKLILKESLEERLASLKEEKATYEEYLRMIDDEWNNIKPFFVATVVEFVSTIEAGYLPEETLEIKLALPQLKGIIHEDTLNKILMNEDFPTRLEFKFLEDMMEIYMPEINIKLTGTFVVVEKQRLLFEVQSGSFLGLPLENSAIEELFAGNYIELNFKNLLDKNIIKSVKINNGNIELYITPVLF